MKVNMDKQSIIDAWKYIEEEQKPFLPLNTSFKVIMYKMKQCLL